MGRHSLFCVRNNSYIVGCLAIPNTQNTPHYTFEMLKHDLYIKYSGILPSRIPECPCHPPNNI